jgi:predicted alpha/beta hydrolase
LSRPAALRSLRGLRADLFDWAADTDAAIERASAMAPDGPLYVVGHSLGAQLAGMLKRRDRISGLVSVAAGSGYWRDNAPPLKRMVLYFWHVLVPVATWACGYFPGARLRKVGDLPRGVIWQWRRWCMHPRYHVGAEGEALRQTFASATFPIVALSMTDDELMTERGTRVLIDCYENAPRELHRIHPSDVQARRIGHFGFFRAQFEPTLWARVTHLFNRFSTGAMA